MSDVKKHQIEMIADRGYQIPDHEKEMLLMNDMDVCIATLAYTQMDYTYTKEGDAGSEIGVFYRKKGNIYVQVDAIQDLLEEIDAGLKYMVVILDGRLSPTARDSLDRMLTCKVQVWMEDELYANPTKHVMTPKHVLLSSESEDLLLRALVKIPGAITPEERTLGKSKLSKMSASDIIRKWYNYPMGSIVQVICDYSILLGAERSAIKYRVVT